MVINQMHQKHKPYIQMVHMLLVVNSMRNLTNEEMETLNNDEHLILPFSNYEGRPKEPDYNALPRELDVDLSGFNGELFVVDWDADTITLEVV